MMSATWNCQDFKRFSTKVHTKIDYIFIHRNSRNFPGYCGSYSRGTTHTTYIVQVSNCWIQNSLGALGSSSSCWRMWGLPVLMIDTYKLGCIYQSISIYYIFITVILIFCDSPTPK
jgi:hypothetical protein